MRSRLMKWGNSLAVRIPKKVAEQAKLSEGASLEIAVEREGRIALRYQHDDPTLDELLARVTSENRHSETRTGRARGKEILDK
ncbi:MAG TPA: AbrB/MazE/SpoVT family DNA-binding domain-containing protein [Terriglobales bacterium]|nr:AbrB/MazE/SpoVT family DNA-binding domain-containing protein [Terriglobales bacterium]